MSSRLTITTVHFGTRKKEHRGEPSGGSVGLDETLSESLVERFLLCPNNSSSGPERRLATVHLTKDSNGSLGIMIAEGLDKGLYIQAVSPGGVAAAEGSLKFGDRIVGINGRSVENVTYGRAVEMLRLIPRHVTLLVSQPCLAQHQVESPAPTASAATATLQTSTQAPPSSTSTNSSAEVMTSEGCTHATGGASSLSLSHANRQSLLSSQGRHHTGPPPPKTTETGCSMGHGGHQAWAPPLHTRTSMGVARVDVLGGAKEFTTEVTSGPITVVTVNAEAGRTGDSQVTGMKMRPKVMPRRTFSSSSSSPSSPTTSPGLTTSSKIPPSGTFRASTTTTTITTSSQSTTITTSSHASAITSCQASTSKATRTCKTSKWAHHSRSSSVSSSGCTSTRGEGGGGATCEPSSQMPRVTKDGGEEEDTSQGRTTRTIPPPLQLQLLVSPPINVASANNPAVDIGSSALLQNKDKFEAEGSSQTASPAMEVRCCSPSGDNYGHKDLLSSLGLNHLQKSVYRASVIHYDEDCDDVSSGSSSVFEYQEDQSSRPHLPSGSQTSAPREGIPHTNQGLYCSKNYSYNPSTNKVCSVEPSEFGLGPDASKGAMEQEPSATSTSQHASSKTNSRLKYLEFAACPTRKGSLGNETPVLKGRVGAFGEVICKGIMPEGKLVPIGERTPGVQKVLHKEADKNVTTQGLGRPNSESTEVTGTNGEARSNQSSWSASSMVPWQGSLEGLLEEEEEGEECNGEGLRSGYKYFRERLERARKPAKFLESVIELPQDSMLDRVFRCFKDLQLTENTSDITSEVVNVDDEFFDTLPVQKLADEYWTRHPGVDNWRDDLFFKDLSLEEEQFPKSEAGSVSSAADQHKIENVHSPISSTSDLGDRPCSEPLPLDASSVEDRPDISASQTSSSEFLETTRLIDSDGPGNSLTLDQEKCRSLYEENIVVTPPIEFRAETPRHKLDAGTQPRKEARSPPSSFRLITEDEYVRSLNEELKRHFESHSGAAGLAPPNKGLTGFQSSSVNKPLPMPSSLAPTVMMQHVDSPECSISNLENPRRISYFRELIACHSNEGKDGNVMTDSLEAAAKETLTSSDGKTGASPDRENHMPSDKKTCRSGEKTVVSPDKKTVILLDEKAFMPPNPETSTVPNQKAPELPDKTFILTDNDAVVSSDKRNPALPDRKSHTSLDESTSTKSQEKNTLVLPDKVTPVSQNQSSIVSPGKKTLELLDKKSSASSDEVISSSSCKKTPFSPDEKTPPLTDMTTLVSPDRETSTSVDIKSVVSPQETNPTKQRRSSKDSTKSASGLTARTKRNSHEDDAIVLKVAAPPQPMAGRGTLSSQIPAAEEEQTPNIDPVSHGECREKYSQKLEPRSKVPCSAHADSNLLSRTREHSLLDSANEGSEVSKRGDATGEHVEKEKESMDVDGGAAFSSAICKRKKRPGRGTEEQNPPSTSDATVLKAPDDPGIPVPKPTRPDTLPLKNKTSTLLPEPPEHDPPLPPQLLPTPLVKTRFLRSSSYLDEAHFLSDTTEDDPDSPKCRSKEEEKEEEKRSCEHDFFFSPAKMLVATLGDKKDEEGSGPAVANTSSRDPTQHVSQAKKTQASDDHLSVDSLQSGSMSLKTENFFIENTMLVARLGSHSGAAEDETAVVLDDVYRLNEGDGASATITVSSETSVTVSRGLPKVDEGLKAPAGVIIKTESESNLRIKKCSSESDDSSDSMPPPINFRTHPLSSDTPRKEEEEEDPSHDSASCDFSDESEGSTGSDNSSEIPQIRVIKMHTKVKNEDLENVTEISSYPSPPGPSSPTQTKGSRFLSHKMCPDSDSDEDEGEDESGRVLSKYEEVPRHATPEALEQRRGDCEKTKAATADADVFCDTRAMADTKPVDTSGVGLVRPKRHPAPLPPTESPAPSAAALPPVEVPWLNTEPLGGGSSSPVVACTSPQAATCHPSSSQAATSHPSSSQAAICHPSSSQAATCHLSPSQASLSQPFTTSALARPAARDTTVEIASQAETPSTDAPAPEKAGGVSTSLPTVPLLGTEGVGTTSMAGHERSTTVPLIIRTCYDTDVALQTGEREDRKEGGSRGDGTDAAAEVRVKKKRPAPPIPVPVPVPLPLSDPTPIPAKSPTSSSSSPHSSCSAHDLATSTPPSPEAELWSGSSSWGVVPPEIADLDGEDFVNLLPSLVSDPTGLTPRVEDSTFEAMVSSMYEGADDDNDKDSTDSAEVTPKPSQTTQAPAEHITDDDGDVLEVFYKCQESTENTNHKNGKPKPPERGKGNVHVDCKISGNENLRMIKSVGLNESSGSGNSKCENADGNTKSLLKASNATVANVSLNRTDDGRKRQFFRGDGLGQEPEKEGQGRRGVAAGEEEEERRDSDTRYTLEEEEDEVIRASDVPVTLDTEMDGKEKSGSNRSWNGELEIGEARMRPSEERLVQPRSNGYLVTGETIKNRKEKRRRRSCCEDRERRKTVFNPPELCRKDPAGNNQVFKLEIKSVTGDKSRFCEEKNDDDDDDDDESKTKGVHLLGTFNFAQKPSPHDHRPSPGAPPDILRSSLLTNLSSPDPSLTDSYISLDAGGCVVEHFNFIGALEKPRDLSLIRQDDPDDYTSLTESVYSEDGKHVIGVFDFTKQKNFPSHVQQNKQRQQLDNKRNVQQNEHNLQLSKTYDCHRLQQEDAPGGSIQEPRIRQEIWNDDSKMTSESPKDTAPLGDSAHQPSLSCRMNRYIAKNNSDGEGDNDDDDSSSSRMSSLRSSLSSPSARSSPVARACVGRTTDSTSETLAASHQRILTNLDVTKVSDSDFEGDPDDDLKCDLKEDAVRGGKCSVSPKAVRLDSNDLRGQARDAAEETCGNILSEGRRVQEEANAVDDGTRDQQGTQDRVNNESDDENGWSTWSLGQGERGTEVCALPASRSAGRCAWPPGGGVGLEAGRRGEVRQGGGHVSPQVEAPDLVRLNRVDLEEVDSTNMLVTDSALQHRDLNHNNRKNAGNSILGTSASKYLVGPHEEEAQVLGGGLQENAIYDAGYSSERSPEDEEGPLICSDHNSSASESSSASSSFRMPTTDEDAERTRLQKALREGALALPQLQHICPFINEGCMFEVTVVKNSRGLGLAVTGGVESTAPWAGLIRIKRLYPQTPAWLCGQLQAGDVILAVNGVSFIGLSSHEALEFLRTTGGEVTLQACRPPAKTLEMEGVIKSPDDRLQVVSTSLTRPFCVSPSSHALLSPSSLSSYGDFEVELTKVAGSLGFTLRKQDNSILGHTIRSLVKEPAISDGRIRAGDKIISVNGTDMCSMSHEEAIAFLRTCPQTVLLRLYRDASQTPVSPVSPSEPELPQLKPKALRKEARDMLSDLAFRKQSPSNSPNMMECTGSPGTLRRRRLQKTPSPDIKSVVADRWDSLVRKTEEDSSSISLRDNKHLDSIKENGENQYPSIPDQDHTPDSCQSTSPSTPNTIIPHSNISNSPSLSPSNSDSVKLRRPDYLDLKSGPVSCPRKTHFTPPHEVDRSFPSSAQSLESTSIDAVDSAPQLTSAQSDTPAFSHLHQGYQSVNLGALHTHEDTRLPNTSSDYSNNTRDGAEGKKSGLLKWKGIVFTPEEEDTPLNNEGKETDLSVSKSLKPKMVTLKLNRGWNSRLGFSLQPQGNVTVVTAIYANSVADKDGRLMIGDQVMKVNGQDVENWKTDDVIDFLRKTKGDISLTVLQQPL